MVKTLHLILLLTCSFVVNAQKIIENPYCIIRYAKGMYNYGEPGQFETIEIYKFVNNGKNIILNEVQKVTNKYEYNSLTSKNDKKTSDTLVEKINLKFKKEELDSLHSNLTTTKDNFTSQFIQSQLPKRIKRSEILLCAKKIKGEFWFIDDETGKLDDLGKELLFKISRYDKFNEYISELRPKSNEILITSHHWNFVEIKFEHKTQIPRMTFHIPRMDFYTALGQPIEIETSEGNWKQIVNLEINILLLKILPKQYQLKKALSFERLKEEYINWYIENKKWK